MSSTGIESSGLSLFLRGHRFRKRMKEANARTETFVISFPKSGRTWHRILLGYYLTRILEQDARNTLELASLCRDAHLPPVAYTHNGTAMSDKLPARHDLVASPIEWKGRRVLLLVREPRDILVSAYFHCRYRLQAFDGSIGEFIRHPYVGIEKLLLAFNRWHASKHFASKFEVISYERMRRQPDSILRQTLRFAGVDRIDDMLITETTNFANMDNLKRLETSNFFRADSMRAGSGDPRSHKVRSGKIGGFREHFSEDDLRYIEQVEARVGNPFPRIKDTGADGRNKK